VVIQSITIGFVTALVTAGLLVVAFLGRLHGGHSGSIMPTEMRRTVELKQEAVAAVLREHGRVTGDEIREHAYFADSGHAARGRRHLLLPALHAVMEEAGWISPGALNHIARVLSVPPADVYGVATFYAMFAVEQRAPHVVHVCDDIACGPHGGEEIAARLTLRRVGLVDPESLDDYRAHGGYTALRRAIELGPTRVIKEVADASLIGRGGAAFPTGVKWDGVARAPERPHYLVCNADESEPGTF
jgi:NADH:ubiquinone oxidoreductase subunit E